MRFVTVLGARPQFVKAAVLSTVLRRSHEEVIVHTGQHYDQQMSDVFFAELGIPEPDYHLGVGSGPHGAQTGTMLVKLEEVLQRERPDIVVVYGDTNSTLAGALAAAKLHMPVAHVEAGLRSFNRAMPEELNRVLTDHLSTWLFTPSELGQQLLNAEGIASGIHIVGDIMLDAVLLHAERARGVSGYPAAASVRAGEFYLCTIHRAENTDDAPRLREILTGLNRLDRPVVLPLHPRTRNRLKEFDLHPGRNVRVIEPVGYLDMLRLEETASTILTDSGGVQKEAYYLGVPCVTLRNETEWKETVAAGWNVVAGTDPDAMVACVDRYRRNGARHAPRPPLYGTGDTADRILDVFEHG